MDFQIRTYNEALRLARCMEMRKYAPNITDAMIKDMYDFISADPNNKIGLNSSPSTSGTITNGTVYYVQADGTKNEAFTVRTNSGFDHIILSAAMFRVVNTTSTDSGCGCGGCSGNNNNNNNNNNNG